MLTDKQERFCLEYIVDLDATAAAVRAGYSKRSAASQGSRLLKHANIKLRISELKRERERQTKYDAAFVLKRLGEEVEADVADLFDEAGALLPVRSWPLIWRQGLVSGLDVEALYKSGGKDKIMEKIGTLSKVKLSDRVKRLELLGKHVDVQAFKERLEVGGALTLEQILDEVNRKDKERNGPGAR